MNSSAEVPNCVLCIITGRDGFLGKLAEGVQVDLWYAPELNMKVFFFIYKHTANFVETVMI